MLDINVTNTVLVLYYISKSDDFLRGGQRIIIV